MEVYMRFHITYLFYIFVTLFIFTIPAFSADDPVTVKAADYICIKAKEGGKTRLAVYPFTGKDGTTSNDTEKYATKIIEVILTKGEFRVIDPAKVSKIVEEQEKGLTGLVDPDTAPETGKMLGADAMIFGITGDGALQIRILDAATGEIIGATVADAGGSAKINNDDFKSADNRDRFLLQQMDGKLRQMSENHPAMFLYVTADDDEMKVLESEFPGVVKRISSRIGSRDDAGVQKFEKRKKRLLQMRKKHPAFNSSIKDMREKTFTGMKSKKKRR